MGYTTDFEGEVEIVPPLNEAERTYLRKFNETRRMDRERGPYFVDSTGAYGQDREADVRDFNAPPAGQPGLQCQWVPNDNGDALEWDDGEKFYDSEDWMAYLIDHFLKPGAEASKTDDPQFADFTFDHVCNGIIDAQGEEPDDRWRLVVVDNVVTREDAEIVFEGDEPEREEDDDAQLARDLIEWIADDSDEDKNVNGIDVSRLTAWLAERRRWRARSSTSARYETMRFEPADHLADLEASAERGDLVPVVDDDAGIIAYGIGPSADKIVAALNAVPAQRDRLSIDP